MICRGATVPTLTHLIRADFSTILVALLISYILVNLGRLLSLILSFSEIANTSSGDELVHLTSFLSLCYLPPLWLYILRLLRSVSMFADRHGIMITLDITYVLWLLILPEILTIKPLPKKKNAAQVERIIESDAERSYACFYEVRLLSLRFVISWIMRRFTREVQISQEDVRKIIFATWSPKKPSLRGYCVSAYIFCSLFGF
ncbi:hypothetical protein M433DRAFT_201019 [Acidomyces richmondensis BFW]|nr:hypothetical protein M433DRAFT_201019 [Acidomyces richmondensis BFW]